MPHYHNHTKGSENDWKLIRVSMAETKCAKWRRDIVPVGLRERGFEAPVYDCVFVST